MKFIVWVILTLVALVWFSFIAKDWEQFLWLSSSIVLFPLAFYGIRWEAAKSGLLWTFRPRNHVIAVDDNPGQNVAILGADENDAGQKEGIEWIGFPPRHVHEFAFVHARINPNYASEGDHDKWIERDEIPKSTHFLLRTITHWVLVPGMKFDGGQQADILLQYQATVAGEEGAQYAIYDSEGKFLDNLNGVIVSNVVSHEILRKMTYDQFRDAEKDENSALMNLEPTEPGKSGGLRWEINRTSHLRSGYKLDSIFVRWFAPTTSEDEKLSREVNAAKIRLAAAKLEARGTIADEAELVRMLKRALPNADHNMILREVSKMSVAKSFAESKTLQAVGGNAMVGLGNNQPSQNRKPRQNKGNKQK